MQVVLRFIDSLVNYCGNEGAKFSVLISTRKGQFMNATGDNKSESTYMQNCIGTPCIAIHEPRTNTISHTSCETLFQPQVGVRDAKTIPQDRSWHAISVPCTLSRQHSDGCNPTSHTNYLKRILLIFIVSIALTNRNPELPCRVQVKKEGYLLHDYCVQTMKENSHHILEEHPPNSFVRFFWGVNQEWACTLKDSRSMRWDPLMIHWCLYLWHLSSRCFKQSLHHEN